MRWSEFKAMVDDLLGVERRRLGVQPFIDRQIRLGVGNVQRLIDYYRKGIVTTYDYDDVARDGFSSRLEPPRGAMLRELYHVRTGKSLVMRPLHEYPFSNRNDLRAGIVGIGQDGGFFRYAIDARDAGGTMWVYPMITRGYAVRIVWDAIVGRTDINYADNDEVPFDEPCADLVYQWVKWKLAREVDHDVALSRDYERTYKLSIGSLYSEVNERLRLRRTNSDADCQTCVDAVEVASSCGCGSTDVLPDGYGYCCEITNPQSEWVMFGDSGERSVISNTISVATAIKALNPDFLIHLGDIVYPTTKRPGDVGSGTTAVGLSKGGSPWLFYDLFTKHYWNFLDCNFYWTLGNHDLEYDYGKSFFDTFNGVAGLISRDNVIARKYFYTFARGPVRFIQINSGIDDNDIYIWPDEAVTYVRQVCSWATEPWIVVFFHRPAYSSDNSHHPGSSVMRQICAQFRSFGVDLVAGGHAHNYERVMDATGLLHVTCGLGGATRRGAADANMPVGSQFFFSDEYGFLHCKADHEHLQWEMVTVDNVIVDRVTLRKTADICAGQTAGNPSSEEDEVQVYYGAANSPTVLPDNTAGPNIWYHVNDDQTITKYVWNIVAQAWVLDSGGGASGFFVVANVAAMRALPNLPTNKQCTTMGEVTAFDNGGRIYVWDATSTEAEAGVSIVKPSDTAAGSPGRWKQL